MVKKAVVRKMADYMIVILLILFICVPLVTILVWSFTKQWPWPELLPKVWSLDSWGYLFSPSGKAGEAVVNSLVIALGTLLGNLLLGIPAARTLSQKNFKGKSFVFITLLSPLFVPFTVSIIGLHFIHLKLDFLHNHVSVIMAHIIITLPYFIASVWFQFRLIGTELQETAKILGANSRKVFLWIELPLLKPAVLLGSILVIVISMSQYLPTWIMSGGTLLTLPMIIFPFASSGNASIVAAYSLLYFVPVIFLVLIYFVLLHRKRKREGVEYGD